eukprot:TRINITY_DN3342_c0_g1_i1.p1 TRINITY_DN3342_c0_g1~~TRINITY_DN3342_c0_g1_i1.p1  ORF type:complete len:309 (-),score=56.17 TRINITY_DN3342_c0_g1_i1:102-1001(-)
MAGSVDELFEIKNNFYLGNYQAAINAATSLFSISDPSLVIERDCYLYRSYIAIGSYNTVLDEVKDNSPTPLQAVKLLATYTRGGENREISLVTLKQWMSDAASTDPMMQLVAGLIYSAEGNYDDALRSVHQCSSLEGRALMVQIYLKYNRVDMAVKELKILQEMDDDATLTQLSVVWVNLAVGGDKLQEAYYILVELADKYGSTASLLSAQAACCILLNRYSDAEKALQEALKKNAKDPETQANYITCLSLTGKPREVINRYANQLRDNSPNHSWVTQLAQAEETFNRCAARYAAQTSS